MSDFLQFQQELNSICKIKGDSIAITYYRTKGRTVECSFYELEDRVNKLMITYKQRGISRGDRVAVLIPLCPNAYIDILALACMGCTSVVLDITMNNEELKRVIENADVSLCITTSQIFNEKFNNIDLPVIEHTDEGSWLNNKLVCHASDPDYEAIAILYSSGTTSRSKGVVIGYKQEMKAMDRLLEVVGTPNIRYLMLFPNSHVSGFTDFLVLLLRGGQLATMEEASATQIMRGFQLYRPNTFGMVPKVWETFMNKIEDGIREKGEKKARQIFKLIHTCGVIRSATGINLGKILFRSINEQVFGGKLIQVHSGGGKSNPDVMRFFYNLGYDTFDFYASTEANVPILVTNGKKYMKSVGNIKSNPNVDIRIWNPDERGVGEIQVKSNTLMRGYFRDKKATDEAFEGEYFKTGDYGIIENNELFIWGRVKESIFLPNGEKVSPDDIECSIQRLIDQPLEFSVFGVNEESGYEHICICVQGENNSLDDYLLEINRKLPVNYRFKEIVYIDELPKTSVGKVKRYQLREMLRKDKQASVVTSQKEKAKRTSSDNIKSVQDPSTFSSAKGLTKKIQDEVYTLKSSKSLKKVGGTDPVAIINSFVGHETKENDDLLNDLGLDSLSLFSLFIELEKECGITIPTQIKGIKTVGDIITLSTSSQSAYSDKETVDYSQFPADRNIRYEKKLLDLIKLLGKLYDINIENEKHLPMETNCIISSNHCSYLDPVFLLYALGEKYIRNTRFATLAAIHTWHENKDFFNMLGGIPVVREGNTLPAIKCVENCLDNGYDVIVFPEGARSRDGSMLPFKNGTAQMAINSNVPIVPIYIDGTFKVLPRHRKHAQLYDYKNRCRIRVNIKFDDPIYPAEHTAESLTEELRNRLEIMESEYRI